jgi:hypothetical protein
MVQMFTAEGVISPHDLVKYGTDGSRVLRIAAATDTTCLGVADLNMTKVASGGKETDDYAIGDQVPVIMDGLVVVKADAGVARGARVMVGATTFYRVITEAASIAGVQQGVGRALTTASAGGDKLVVLLRGS